MPPGVNPLTTPVTFSLSLRILLVDGMQYVGKMRRAVLLRVDRFLSRGNLKKRNKIRRSVLLERAAGRENSMRRLTH
jgi:hypothetical protein